MQGVALAESPPREESLLHSSLRSAPQTGGISIAGELLGKADSWAPPRPTESETLDAGPQSVF